MARRLASCARIADNSRMPDMKSLRDALDTVMARDVGRLLARWRRVSAHRWIDANAG